MKERQQWAIKTSGMDEKKIKFGIVAANNHYAGFGPATADMFRKMVGLPEAIWDEKRRATLTDF
jgi:hypothetical protein